MALLTSRYYLKKFYIIARLVNHTILTDEEYVAEIQN
jgi:hypothetical protein